jgi:hypothetical protein
VELRGDQEEVVREEGRASALRDGCLCTCLLKHGQGPESSQPYDRFPQNSANTRHRAKAISAAISRNHISWQYRRSGRLLRDAILGRFMFLNRLCFHGRHVDTRFWSKLH